MTSTLRHPHPLLAPFVRTLWVSTGPSRAAREWMLPSAAAHLVFRLNAEPVEITETTGASARFGTGVVGGPRCGPYIRSAAATGLTAGAVLRPGATETLFDVSGGDLARRHTDLGALWGFAADRASDRLAAAGSEVDALDALETILIERLRRQRPLHPAVSALLRTLPSSTVRAAVDATGYSHRHVTAVFTCATGMTPKQYSRLRRFERTLSLWGRDPRLPVAILAARAGFSDQAHLSRDFTQFAGLTPSTYRAAAAVGSRHVRCADVDFLQDSTSASAAESRP